MHFNNRKVNSLVELRIADTTQVKTDAVLLWHERTLSVCGVRRALDLVIGLLFETRKFKHLIFMPALIGSLVTTA
jgi:hypothetical protein